MCSMLAYCQNLRIHVSKIIPTDVSSLFKRALAFHKSGDWARAKAIYSSILDIQPKYFDAIHMLGVLYIQTGNPNKGLKFIDKAIEINPRNAEAYYNKAEALLQENRLPEAISNYRKLIELSSKDHEALFKIASIFREMGQYDDTLSHLDRAISVSKDNHLYYHAKADTLSLIGQEADAVEFYGKSIASNPNFALSYNNRAVLNKQMGLLENARKDLLKAIDLEPFNDEYHFNLGNLYKAMGDLELAIKSYHVAIDNNAHYLQAHFNLANTYLELEKFAEAVVGYDHVIRLDPAHAQAHRHRGTALQKLNRRNDALQSFNAAIDLGGQYPDAFLSRSIIWSEMGNFEASLADSKTYLNFFTNNSTSAISLLNSWIQFLQIGAMPTIFKSQDELVETRKMIEDILDRLLSMHSNGLRFDQDQMNVAKQAILMFNGFYIAYHQMNDRETMRKVTLLLQILSGTEHVQIAARKSVTDTIRIGIASQRLRNHNGANWAYNWVRNLPQNKYEFYTYNFESVSDEMSKKFEALGTHRQLNLNSTSHSEIISLIRDDALDYLMLPDVGMTPLSRILSIHKLAPRQFTAWGHPVTSGAAAMDYYLSSDLMEPEDGKDHYTENLVRLPNLALYLEPRKSLERVGRDLGFPSGRILFGCVQSLFKYIPKYDSLFPLVAKHVPDALFIFIESNYAYMTAIFRDRLKSEFERHGLNSDDYVRFIPGMSALEFSNLLTQMDVCIDSVGWSGGNTTIECVELSVPFATLPGEFMRGRHSSAILNFMGCEELIAETFEGYIEILTRLGRDSEYRRHVSELFKSRRGAIYRDKTFIDAFDRFLIDNRAQGDI